mmetsp:Transcript_103111/g.183215  ORF Transcript_103111/g.183215 Transcript_103111/m.183215 type:complete len:203 (+) Transcript_103111:17-625(+)
MTLQGAGHSTPSARRLATLRGRVEAPPRPLPPVHSWWQTNREATVKSQELTFYSDLSPIAKSRSHPSLGLTQRTWPSHSRAGQTQTAWKSRSMTTPRDHLKWEAMPAGRSTIDMDQPQTSQHLANIRYYGSPMPWRCAGEASSGRGDDGMEMQASFGQTCRLSQTSQFFRSQNNLPQLRLKARNSINRIGATHLLDEDLEED